VRIQFVTPWFPTPADPVDGSFIAAQAAALVNLGHAVSCCVVRPIAPWPIGVVSRKWQVFALTPALWTWNGLEAHRHRYLSVPRYLLYGSEGRRVARSLRIHVRGSRADVTVAHTELAAEAVLRAVGHEHPPVVAVIHGINLAPGMRSTQLRRANLRWTLERSSRVVVVGPRLVPVVAAWGAPMENIRVVPNGFDEALVAAGPAEHRELREGRLEILSVSNLVPGKGIDTNLRALALACREGLNAHYGVVGEGRSRRTLEHLADSLGIRQRVRFLGRLEPAGVHRELAACDLFSLPSSPEAFGIAYLEAMAHGKPIVGCIGEGPEVFCRDGEHGFLVPPADAGAVAAAWARLADKVLRTTLGRAARTRVNSEFTWDRSARQLEAVLREVARQAA
jgi:glycosyltransferase involved in cell wall biosynthesis